MKNNHSGYSFNLANKPFINNFLPMLLTVIVLTIILAFTAFNVIVFLSAETDSRGLTDKIENLNSQNNDIVRKIALKDEQIKEINIRRLRGEIEYVNGLIAQHSLNWTKLFDRLESICPAELKMIKISPNVREGVMELSWRVQVPRQEVIREFIQNLEASEHFDDIKPSSESEAQDGGSVWELTVKYFD